jgi:hypothetical protein
MRKLLFSVLLAASCSVVFAQKIEDVKEKIGKGKYDEAKEKIDKVMADPKNANNSEAWFYDAVVYHNLAKANPTDTADAQIALNAIRKYMQLEQSQPENKRYLLSTLESHKTAFDIYQTYFNNGVNSFKNKDYNGALYNFEKTLESFDYLSKGNLTNVKFDTTSTIYAALSAHNAKNYPAAAKYYGKMTDARIADSSYIDAYEFMISYYLSEKKDTAAAERALRVGEEVFPKRDWMDYELSMIPNDKDSRMAKYEQLMSRYPDNTSLMMQYAVDQYNHTFIYEKKPADYNDRKAKAKDALDKVVKKDPNSPLANFIYSQYFKNDIYDLEDDLHAVKGNAPADAAKRKDINARMDKAYEDMYTYSQKAYDLYGAETTMKAQDKANYSKAINQLIDYYTRKKQNDKVTFYQDKLKQLK